MAQKVADVLWEMLAKAGVKRCYGIVGDALNPVIDALRRNGKIEFIHVRHEEYGVFAAVADAYLSGNPVVVCGTAGPGVTHLFNGLMDAQGGSRRHRDRRRCRDQAHRHRCPRRAEPLQIFRYRLPLRRASRQPRTTAGGRHDRDSDGRRRQGSDRDLIARRHRLG